MYVNIKVVRYEGAGMRNRSSPVMIGSNALVNPYSRKAEHGWVGVEGEMYTNTLYAE